MDTKGLPLFVMVTPADLTDRNAAREVLFRLRLMHPEITIVWADSAYAGQLVDWAKTFLNLTIKTVSRPKGAVGFVVLPRRWVVERSHAWVMHARRHARDYERLVQHSESLITWAAITLMTRRITRRSSRRSGQPASREAPATDHLGTDGQQSHQEATGSLKPAQSSHHHDGFIGATGKQRGRSSAVDQPASASNPFVRVTTGTQPPRTS